MSRTILVSLFMSALTIFRGGCATMQGRSSTARGGIGASIGEIAT